MGNHPRDYEALRRSEREAEAIRDAKPIPPLNPYQPLQDEHNKARERPVVPQTVEEKAAVVDEQGKIKIRLMHEDKRNEEDIANAQRRYEGLSQQEKAHLYDQQQERKEQLEQGDAYAKSKGKTLSYDQQRELDTYREIDRRIEQERKNDGRDR